MSKHSSTVVTNIGTASAFAEMPPFKPDLNQIHDWAASELDSATGSAEQEALRSLKAVIRALQLARGE